MFGVTSETEERKMMMNKFINSHLVFSDLGKVSETYGVDFTTEEQRDIVSLHSSALVSMELLLPIPYVHVLILNLSHPYLKGTTVLLDMKFHL